MRKYEVTKKEAVPRQEALAAWPGNHKESGPPVESSETIVSGPYPDVSIAQVAELHEKHVSMMADGTANLHALLQQQELQLQAHKYQRLEVL